MATSGMAGVYRSDGASRGETGPGLFWRDMARSDDTRQAGIGMYWIGEVRRAVERRGRHGTVGKDRLGAAGQGEARSDKTTQARNGKSWADQEGHGDE